MTLGELAAQAQKLLETLPADTPVFAEGCDCTGVASRLAVHRNLDAINRHGVAVDLAVVLER